MTDPIYCDDCNAAVRVERNDNNSLVAVCACGSYRNIKTSRVFPEAWRKPENTTNTA
jgi:hypothetical protein